MVGLVDLCETQLANEIRLSYQISGEIISDYSEETVIPMLKMADAWHAVRLKEKSLQFIGKIIYFITILTIYLHQLLN